MFGGIGRFCYAPQIARCIVRIVHLEGNMVLRERGPVSRGRALSLGELEGRLQKGWQERVTERLRGYKKGCKKGHYKGYEKGYKAG